MSELDYLKGTPIVRALPAAQARRLAELKATLAEYAEIDAARLAGYVGKRGSKGKDRAAEEYRFHRDLLAFLERVPPPDPL